MKEIRGGISPLISERLLLIVCITPLPEFLIDIKLDIDFTLLSASFDVYMVNWSDSFFKDSISNISLVINRLLP